MLVIGGGKTAIDVALVTAAVADSTTLLARRGHWWAPEKVLGESSLGGQDDQSLGVAEGVGKDRV